MSENDFTVVVPGQTSFSPYYIDSIMDLLIWDSQFLADYCRTVRSDDGFTSIFSGERGLLCDMCCKFFAKHNSAPKGYIYDVIESQSKLNPKTRTLLFTYLNKILDNDTNKKFVAMSFGKFLRTNICKQVIDKAKVLTDQDKVAEAENLVLEGFRRAVIMGNSSTESFLAHGFKSDYIYDDSLELNFRTFIDPIDKFMDGFFRNEMLLVFGGKGIGKSWFMVYLGKVAMIQGKRVLHITLETSIKLIRERYIMTMMGIDKSYLRRTPENPMIRLDFKDLDKKLNMLKRRGADLWLHETVRFTFSDLVNYVNRIELDTGGPPDLIILDSTDQMILSNDANKYRFEEKALYKNLLEFKKEKNISLVVTTQANRKVSEKKSTKGVDVAEGFDKVRVVDTVYTLSQNAVERTKDEFGRDKVRLAVEHARGNEEGLVVRILRDLRNGQFVSDILGTGEEYTA
jgi:KaiC/GvpD/RAD55 family RecA-like ATPase